jgi:hypothetical protein
LMVFDEIMGIENLSITKFKRLENPSRNSKRLWFQC